MKLAPSEMRPLQTSHRHNSPTPQGENTPDTIVTSKYAKHVPTGPRLHTSFNRRYLVLYIHNRSTTGSMISHNRSPTSSMISKDSIDRLNEEARAVATFSTFNKAVSFVWEMSYLIFVRHNRIFFFRLGCTFLGNKRDIHAPRTYHNNVGSFVR